MATTSRTVRTNPRQQVRLVKRCSCRLTSFCGVAVLMAQAGLLAACSNPSRIQAETRGGEDPAVSITSTSSGYLYSNREAASGPEERSMRSLVRRWWQPVGVLLMALSILGFLGFSALFLPPLGAWFIYLFLVPFLIWLPGMALGPAAGWVCTGLWLLAFPLLRHRILTSRAGARLRRAYLGWWNRFGSGSPGGAGSFANVGRRPGASPSTSGSRGSSRPVGKGGRFGGGGASGRW